MTARENDVTKLSDDWVFLRRTPNGVVSLDAVVAVKRNQSSEDLGEGSGYANTSC